MVEADTAGNAAGTLQGDTMAVDSVDMEVYEASAACNNAGNQDAVSYDEAVVAVRTYLVACHSEAVWALARNCFAYWTVARGRQSPTATTAP